MKEPKPLRICIVCQEYLDDKCACDRNSAAYLQRVERVRVKTLESALMSRAV